MPSSPLAEQGWHDELVRNYLLIPRRVQELQAELHEAETAVRAIGARRPDIDVNATASHIFKYNLTHRDANQTDLDSITNLNVARKFFQESRKQAKEIYEILWCEEDEHEWEVMAQLIEVRGMVRQLVEVDLVVWEGM